MKVTKLTLLVLSGLVFLAGCGGSSDSAATNTLNNATSKVGTLANTCKVEINKTCLVNNVPAAQFPAEKCDGKLQQFTLVWEGSDAITVSGVDNDSNNSQVNNGDEVTFFGPFDQNDVVVTIDGVGYSVFHMSCSDENFNSADDCNKLAGDGKSDNPTYINQWSLEGFIDASDQVLDCSPPISDQLPTADSCEVKDMPGMDCDALGKPVALSFRYHQGSVCNSSANSQGSKTACTDSGTLGPHVAVAVLNDEEKFQLSDNTSCLSDGEEFTVTPTGSSFPSRFELQLSDCQPPMPDPKTSQKTSGSSQTLDIHLSCSAPLAVGDVFGALELTSFNDEDGSVDLVFGYKVENTGTVSLADLNIVDGNDTVVFDAPETNDPLFNPAQPFILDAGKTAKFTASATAFTGTSSSAQVLRSGNTVCGTSKDVPVVKVLPPACMLSIELYKIEDDKIKYKIFNDGTNDIFLSQVKFAWPGSGLLEKVKFDGDEIIKDVALTSPVDLNSFLKDESSRELKAEDYAKIEFEFDQKFPMKDEQPATDFNYSFDFGEDSRCSVTNNPPDP
ncbi:MAG: hypothetical protein HKN88_04850 [Gammaproteobacteria bacterium]|nr:hypothetical protein [Gammaproteobacteria bacterium]NNC97382.1 hypothetical protein [Gammaproteobacteria bacterium]